MTIGAAGLGGIAGVVLFGSLPGAVLLSSCISEDKYMMVLSDGRTSARL